MGKFAVNVDLKVHVTVAIESDREVYVLYELAWFVREKDSGHLNLIAHQSVFRCRMMYMIESTVINDPTRPFLSTSDQSNLSKAASNLLHIAVGDDNSHLI